MTGPVAADPVFEQVAGLALYALSSRGQAAVPGYWAGYRPSKSLTPPPTLTFEASWRDIGGVYLFCARTPADPAAFLAALDGWLAANSPQRQVRLLWLADPAAPVTSWAPPRIEAVQHGPPDWEVLREATFTVGGYSVIVPAGSRLRARSAAAAGIWVLQSVRLRAMGADYACTPGMAWIPLIGPRLGAWSSMVRPGGDGNPTELTGLSSQLRYTANRPGGQPAHTQAHTVSMPVIGPPRPWVTCSFSFDSLYPLAPERTQFILGQTGGFPSTLSSHLRTPLGHPVTLTPQDTPTQTPWPAKLVFNVSPRGGGERGGAVDYYLTPDGAFLIGAHETDRRVALGLSGLEYAALPPTSGTCRFVAGQPAYAGDDAVLTAAGTTAYVDLLPAGPDSSALAYYTQPQRAPWYATTGAERDGFLPAMPLPAATLPGWPPSPPDAGNGVPVGCYTGVAAADAAVARWLEDAVIAPARRAGITGPAPVGPATRVVTPQGLLATAATGGAGWDSVVLASFPDAAIPELALTGVSAVMRGAMAASELFMVIADQDVLMDNASVRYRLQPPDMNRLARAGVPAKVVSDINLALRELSYPTFDSEGAFRAVVEPVAGGYLKQVLAAAGQLKVCIDDWTAQLSPRSWRTDEKAPTVMLVKYGGRALADLVAEPKSWTWPEAAGDIGQTQRVLTDMIGAAAAAPADSPEGRFYRDVAADPRWAGVLFINAPVVAAELPDELRFVAAGIDPKNFYAHHIGFGYTPFEAPGGAVKLRTTAAFGLVRYTDTTELAPTTTVPFQFVTQQLEVRFANSAVAGLSARVQLVVNELFGSRLIRADTVTGNALTLTGSYQRQGGVLSYRFALDAKARYLTEAAALDSVEVLGVAVRTLRTPADDPSADDQMVAVEFALGGNLRFAALPGFDLFSYGPQPGAPLGKRPADGYLRFDDLTVTMEFPAGDPTDQVFTADEGRVRVDLANSVLRDGSLVAGFPVEVTGVAAVPRVASKARSPGRASAARRAGPAGPVSRLWRPRSDDEPDPGLSPEDLGYVSVLAPIDQVPLQPPWYGLIMRLDLGSLGPLANQAGLSATVLAGWMPGSAAGGEGGGDGTRPVYCGLRLGTGKAIDADWPVQGVLRVGFRGFEFLVDHSDEAPAYLLRLRRLALSVLGWSFPPGQTDVLVFGDPHTTEATTVGWYGAYASPASPAASLPARRALARRARRPGRDGRGAYPS